ncbi:phosphogluconate dehydratase (plasmid) [Agrobacterium tumefaciens]|uniref:Phosphogluconate dehydratase n=2 Tax=Rhizobium/Agrobacterium group TaxID=227290 RepID=A0A2Z2PHX8_AGRTU|nr:MULTISPECIES: phosphogluconate dehydratase [Rhizobium/Agrobacterium group]ASK41002.1 phosphogluconate dehydratase [Rhizobium rhizogenes]ASK41172.1 phosphogluconate dehydratase [Agrobacterium tumefaciens]NSZ87721.1 phosphogluconate dehydratase [Agrobacterium tumefaciens]NTI46516.1 phosphogluconate dehydratase [Rhizobium rhizogenes]NTI66017.1 phosphogluconate dehydratase [Rhizobium rhizogenes]
MSVHTTIQAVTGRIAARSAQSRQNYLELIEAQRKGGVHRSALSCGNLAHGFAACSSSEKAMLSGSEALNLGIVTSYNDMLSAHQPYGTYPDIIKAAAHAVGATAQIAGGVPAMCDGVTQGQPGMDLSLFSRDVIAMSTAIALSHNMFDAAVYLGVCDKIVPGLLIGALSFGHLPAVFVPAGPMTSGLSNDEKARIRQLSSEGKIDRARLLDAEAKSYHSPGTCTFYGTANSNQMLMEIMGLHIPGSSFVNANTSLREALTREATRRALSLTAGGKNYTPIGHIIDERSIVNGIVGLLSTGGSTNHTLHIIAIAQAAGLHVTWQDMSDLSDVVPLLARVYPNGSADVNHFHSAGGMGFLIRELIDGGFLHEDVDTIWGRGLRKYAVTPGLEGNEVVFHRTSLASSNPKVLAPVSHAFSPNGGLKLLSGNIGKSVIKVSAVKPENRVIEAPARVFHAQEELQQAFRNGELDGDLIAVVRFQGPRSIGMPELHKLTPALGVLQDRGFKVALVTDGRMSGASGKVPAAIHITPEASDGGAIAKIRDGDLIKLDANVGTLTFLGDEEEFHARPAISHDLRSQQHGTGRELFARCRSLVSSADQGASILGSF